MDVEFELIGEGERPSAVGLPVLPRKGDQVEYRHTIYSVIGIRFLLGDDSPRILISIEKDGLVG